MKGNIYPAKYGYKVRYGRKISKRFKHFRDAEDFLIGLRFKDREGSLDIRDYQKGNPLGFETLALKWLKIKKKRIKSTSYAPYKNYMTQAIESWGNANIKAIGYAEIEDFLFMRDDISDKTRHNMKACLSQFFSWCADRLEIPKPKFPKVSFELGWRNIIDIPTQQRIINKVREISYNTNPKIWLGVRFLATYVAIRPGELINIREDQISREMGAIIIPHPKEKKPKIIYLTEDDLETIKGITRGLPQMHFFRHPKGIAGVVPGTRFGVHYLWKWWKRACNELNIVGVDLYGGTRHSTVTALGKICTPGEVRDATGHTSKAFERYFQDRAGRARAVTDKIIGLSEGGQQRDNQNKVVNFDK